MKKNHVGIVCLRMIYFQYLDCKSSYTIYYIDFTLLIAVLRRWKGELFFTVRCSMIFFFVKTSKRVYFTGRNTGFF